MMFMPMAVQGVISRRILNDQLLLDSLDHHGTFGLELLHPVQPVSTSYEVRTVSHLLARQLQGIRLQDQILLPPAGNVYSQGDFCRLNLDGSARILAAAHKPGLQSVLLDPDLYMGQLFADYVEDSSMVSLVSMVFLCDS